MTVLRTISQLPRTNSLKAGSLFEIASPDTENSKFISQSVEFEDVSDAIKQDISSSIQEGLEDDIDALKQRIADIENGDTQLSGVQDFKNFPKTTAVSADLTKYGGTDLNVIPNIALVREEIKSGACFVSTNGSIISEGDPMPSGKIRYSNFVHGSQFYYWHIDAGTSDSALAVRDDISQTVDPYETIRESGILVVWGWLTDNGSVRANEAWVALMACLKPEDSDSEEKYYPISVQPWIAGSKSNVLQYVGFTVPVAAGTRLKICTGFNVSDSSSAFQGYNTMTFTDINIPNSFFGYIIKSNKAEA